MKMFVKLRFSIEHEDLRVQIFLHGYASSDSDAPLSRTSVYSLNDLFARSAASASFSLAACSAASTFCSLCSVPVKTDSFAAFFAWSVNSQHQTG